MPIFQTQDNPSATHNHDTVYYTQDAADSAFAATGHNHDAAYSATGHNHDAAYSATTHNHDSDYLPADAALGDLSNVDETGKTDGQSVVWNAGASKYVLATVTSGGGVTDHGALTGLGDDDHTQYHNDTRGDARYSLLAHNHTGVYAAASHSHNDLYYTEAEVTSLLAGKSATTHNHDASYAAAAHTHDTRYYTETEMDVLLAAKSATTHNHSGVYAAASHTHDDRYYTETETDIFLAGKASTAHLHDNLPAGSGSAFTWGSGWSDQSGATALAFTKVGNVVHANGRVKRTSGSGLTIMCTLSAAYRPSYDRYVTLWTRSGTTYIVYACTVNTLGNIAIVSPTATTGAIEDAWVDFTYPLD